MYAQLRRDWPSAVGYSVIGVVGVVLFAAHAGHAFAADEDVWTFLYGIVVPLAFSFALLLCLVWLTRQPFDGRDELRIAAWTIGGVLVLGLGAELIVLYQAAHGTQLDDAIYVVASASSIGSVLGFVLGVYDGRQRRARAAHAAEQERTERLNRQLGVVNRVLRHDIRNSANVIRGRAGHLKKDREETPNLDAIEERAAKLVALGEHATDVERVVRTEDTDRREVDLVAVLEDELEAVRNAHGPIDVDRSLPAAAPVRTHPLVGIAIENVLENAVVHNSAERPFVRVELTRTDDGDRIELRVVDDGPGIPEQEVEVLERGYETQLDHTSGLGLWLVNWIVTQSGGAVAFEHHDELGSVVCLTFDAAPGER